LVVIAIIALLMALLLPAIQKVREAANKMLCGSNLRQIAIACHNYHNDYLRLPPGSLTSHGALKDTWSYNVTDGPVIGTMVLLLPYLEADNIKKLFTFNESDTGVNNTPGPTENWWLITPSTLATRNQAAAQAKLKMFECPSDNVRDQTPNYVIIASTWFYDGVSVPNWWIAEPWAGYYPNNPATPFWTSLGRTNYFVCGGGAGTPTGASAGNDIFGKYQGCFSNRSKLTLGQLTVQDGTSNTILLGESLAGNRVGTCDSVVPWIAPCQIAVGAGLGRGGAYNEDMDPSGNGWNPANQSMRGGAWWRFSAMHAAGPQFAFGDGSIRTIRYGQTTPPTANITTATPLTIDYMLLLQMAGRRDGLNYDLSSIYD